MSFIMTLFVITGASSFNLKVQSAQDPTQLYDSMERCKVVAAKVKQAMTRDGRIILIDCSKYESTSI